jgi:hypothetical protein
MKLLGDLTLAADGAHRKMRAAVTTTVARFVPEKRQQVRGAQLAGLAVASIVPALLWSLLIDAVATWFNSPLSLTTVFLIGGAIALFLAVICAPLILRPRD